MSSDYILSELKLEKMLNYLHKGSEGTQAFIINKLYSFSPEKVTFYLPQLFNFFLHTSDPQPIARFFIDESIRSHSFALKLYWFVSAAMADELEGHQVLLQEMHRKLETAIINSALPYKKSSDITDYYHQLSISKRIKADYFDYEKRLGGLLCKVSIGLSIISSDQRNHKLRCWLHELDLYINEMRNTQNSNEEETRLFRGVHLPFEFQNKQPIQVVKLHPKYSFCFNSKARVPYKCVLECVSKDEEAVEVEDYRKSKANPVLLEHLLQQTNLQEESEASSEENSDTRSTEAECMWGEPWPEFCERLRKNSCFGHFETWNLTEVIVKGLDDLRQELLAMQFIRKIKDVFDSVHLKLFLRPYDILILSNNMGIIECIPNTHSIHSIKKRTPNFTSLLNFFADYYEDFLEAQKNFVESMAGYSLVCYLLNVRDRHNGNILLDNEGHIIHIDFGFFLTSSPGGNLNFETSPFKLTTEMVEVMGGYEGEMYKYFKVLLFQGFVQLRRHYEELAVILEMMGPGENLPCMRDFERAKREFFERFRLDLAEDQCFQVVEGLCDSSAGNWRTYRYDYFQWLTNGIL